MPKNDNFKTERNNFLEKAIAHLSNLTRLEVNTLVGKYTFNKKAEVRTTIVPDSTEERMCSQINLITGDITVAMTDKFADEYKELREYHIIRENQGHAIIDKNIETLKTIISALDIFRGDIKKDDVNDK